MLAFSTHYAKALTFQNPYKIWTLSHLQSKLQTIATNKTSKILFTVLVYKVLDRNQGPKAICFIMRSHQSAKWKNRKILIEDEKVNDISIASAIVKIFRELISRTSSAAPVFIKSVNEKKLQAKQFSSLSQEILRNSENLDETEGTTIKHL